MASPLKGKTRAQIQAQAARRRALLAAQRMAKARQGANPRRRTKKVVPKSKTTKRSRVR
jgi:hypothetical protein